MKSNTTLTTATRCFALAALGISLVSSVGCYCKSRGSNSFCNHQPIRHEVVQTEPDWTIDEISPSLNEGALEDDSRQRSGLLVEFRNSLPRSRSRSGIEDAAENSQTEVTAEDSQIVTVAERKPTDKSPGMIKSSRRNVLISTERDSIVQQKNGSEKLEVAKTETNAIVPEKSDRFAASPGSETKQVLPQLKPLARLEPASTTRQRVANSLDSVSSVSAMQPVVMEPSTEGPPVPVQRQTTPTQLPAQSESSQQSTVLPRSTARSTQRVTTQRQHPDHVNTDSDRTQRLVSSVPNGLEQPLALEIRDGDWPVYPDVDPVARAYEIRKKSKAQFRDLASQNLMQPSQPSNPTMHMVGHRRRVNEATQLDEAALSHDRSNWVPTQKPTRENTGLQLRATSRSVPVPISPIAKITPSGQRDLDARADEQPLQIEFQPREWPRQPNSIDLLPLDDVGPIFDLPTSENLRRLTVRPESEEEEKAIDR